MTSKVRSVVAIIGYALVGALLIGGVGTVIGFSLAPDDGLQAVFNAAVGGIGGAVVGCILGVVVFVAGSNALERENTTPRRGTSRGSNG